MSKEKAKVSVYVLAYNEEAKIEDCIKSVLWADEVVLIDSHSTDKTAQIAEELGAKVVQVDFEGFGKKFEWLAFNIRLTIGFCPLMQMNDVQKKQRKRLSK